MVNAVLKAPTRIDVKVDKEDGRLSPTSPIYLRNAVSTTLTDIAQIQNVVEINKTENATLVYNSSTNRYEIKPLTALPSNLDGGTF